MRFPRLKYLALLLLITSLLGACSAGDVSDTVPASNASTAPAASAPPLEPTYAAQIRELRSPDVPELPFPDNPDPNQCGIPVPFGENQQAWLTGYYAGELIQKEVLLYDSHLRLNITAGAAHGSEVQVLLYQENPVVDYYLVKIVGAGAPNEGWVPAPFLSFEPVEHVR